MEPSDQDFGATGRPGRSWSRTARHGVLGTASFVALLWVYSGIQRLVEPRFSFVTRWDDAIPFVPAMIWVYLAFFLVVPLTASRLSRRELVRALRASVYSCLAAWACFLLVPASLPRPDASVLDGPWLGTLFQVLHEVDASHNTFPSLHVAVTWICFLSLRRRRGMTWKLAAAVLISASTLFVKQHTILDVAGGVALAFLSFRVARLGTVQEASPS